MLTVGAILKVYPDNTTHGSEGRLCLQLPPEATHQIPEGTTFRTVGMLSRDRYIVLVPLGSHTVTPNGQIWWKNGVRDHGVRRNHFVRLHALPSGEVLVKLLEPTADPAPELPPQQMTFF